MKSKKLMRNLTLVVFTKSGNSRDDSEKSECHCDSLSLHVFSVNKMYVSTVVAITCHYYNNTVLFFFPFLREFRVTLTLDPCHPG